MAKNNVRRERSVLNVENANALWNLLDISVEKFTSAINVHDSHTFVGYAYLTIRGRENSEIPGLKFLALGTTGAAVKLWNDGHVEVQFRELKGDDGVYRPVVFPLTHEMRACVELAVKKDARVLRGLFQAAETRAEKSETPSDEQIDSAFGRSATARQEGPFSE